MNLSISLLLSLQYLFVSLAHAKPYWGIGSCLYCERSLTPFTSEITWRWSVKPGSAIAPVVIPHHPTCLLSQLEPGWLSDSPLPGAVLLPFPRGVLRSFLIPVSVVLLSRRSAEHVGTVRLMNQLPDSRGSCEGTTPCGGLLNPGGWTRVGCCPFSWQRQRHRRQKGRRLLCVWF